MIDKITQFFNQLAVAKPTQETEISTNLACAFLLVEVMLADGELADKEKQLIIEILQQHFNLSADEAEKLIKHAIDTSAQATDYYQFTKRINEAFSIEQKINMVTFLWQVAKADGEVSSIEQHTIRKIADLLHLRHNEYVQSKRIVLQ
jgi:uncharacterized tellurite resistance protein B-like protein